ncbi:N-acetylglucosamine-6-phosphate deacetylase [Kribbella sp. CA-293567]|uniref:N-acetylglucosamine-6-phosphate deacetylase n=1 Tax=Kribbella sp. CA-293567 TaxID=3002436 RepID=UPI0022DE6ED1|nr:amidohydrolase family protein [Kribbella sp. CA-293567]WBQ03448.1 amidohydrolase family protein [Kribbella sp. CA-293567]
MRTTVTGRDPSRGETIAVTIVDGRIARITPVDSADSADLANSVGSHSADPGSADPGSAGPGSALLIPGLVDLQVNGFGGHDANADDVSPATIRALTHALRATGVTTYVPTLVTGAHERIAHALAQIADARRRDPELRHAIPYVHLEGPHISAEEGPRGVHDPEHIRPPSRAEFEAWQEASGGLIGMVTLSPHYPDAPAYTSWLVERGVHVAVGHTHATPDQLTAVVDAGARLCTHLGNGAHAVLPRHPNYLWTQLADHRLTAGFIADGHHLPDDTLTAMIRAKGLDRALLVSDAVSLAGMPPGRYDAPVGGTVDLTAEGRLSRSGTPYLAGAARGLADGVAQAARSAGLSLGDAVRLATEVPGRFVGGRGRMQVGATADLVRCEWAPGDASLTIESVYVAGRCVSQRGGAH